MKLQKTNKNQYFITLPKILVEMKEWQKGQELKIMFSPQGQIIILEKQKNRRSGDIGRGKDRVEETSIT